MKKSLKIFLGLSCLLVTITLCRIGVVDGPHELGRIFFSSQRLYASSQRPSAKDYLKVPVPPLPEEVKIANFKRIIYNTSLSGETLRDVEEVLDNMIKIMTKPQITCKRTVRQGGHYCNFIPDGHKKVCLDSFAAPSTNSCLVYSFGVGGELTFDAAMGKFGCHVFAFDDDAYHSTFPRYPFPNVTFLLLRISTNRQVRTEYVIHPAKNKKYMYLYRPIDNIMYLLHHYQANLDVLKIDVEGPEFEMFENSIFKTDILEHTRQLAIEIHLQDLLYKKLDTGQQLLQTLANYTRIFQELKARGMELAYYEPNFLKPAMITLAGRTFSINGEQVWINTKLKEGRKWNPTHLSEKQIDQIEAT